MFPTRLEGIETQTRVVFVAMSTPFPTRLEGIETT